MPGSPAYVAYFDESGDHGMDNIDPTFPVFVLCGWVFKIEEYANRDAANFTLLKFRHFGHDAVVFHSRQIRKRLGPFQILVNREKRETLLGDLSAFFTACSGTLIAVGIDKVRHKAQYHTPLNPYELSVIFCLERLFAYLRDQGESRETPVFCIFEERGPVEDASLAARFERICSGANQWGVLPFRMIFANKQQNMPGLQMADLAAYPIARHLMDPNAPNPSWDAIYPRFRRSPGGAVRGWGLKFFP